MPMNSGQHHAMGSMQMQMQMQMPIQMPTQMSMGRHDTWGAGGGLGDSGGLGIGGAMDYADEFSIGGWGI